MEFHKLLGLFRIQKFFSVPSFRTLSSQEEVLCTESQFQEAVESIQCTQQKVPDLVGI